jgi:hypothetical protein
MGISPPFSSANRLSERPAQILALLWLGRVATRTKGLLLPGVHYPAEMAIWTFAMDAPPLRRIPSAEGEGHERDDRILNEVLDHNPPDAVMSLMMPRSKVIVEAEDADRNENDVNPVFAHSG